MTILIIVLIIFLVLLLGMLIALIFSRMSYAVTNVQAEMAAEEQSYNLGMTLGHRIKVDSGYEEQLKQARIEAAKVAAATPRGGNFPLGRSDNDTPATAGKSASSDPMTAVRIARFHGWDGARTGIPPSNIPAGGMAPAVATATGAPATAGIAPPQLIEITDDMAPEDVRKARVANAKAQSAYNKALKAAQSGAPEQAMAPAAAAAPAAAPSAPAAAGIAPPLLIEITDDMAPEDVRKARVANAKAQSAYNKALKAAGVDPSAMKDGAPAAVAAPVPVAEAAVETAAPAIPAGIAPPQLIEITDDMPPEEIRRARVANAKAQSAYNKALKAAGIDPASVK